MCWLKHLVYVLAYCLVFMQCKCALASVWCNSVKQQFVFPGVYDVHMCLAFEQAMCVMCYVCDVLCVDKFLIMSFQLQSLSFFSSFCSSSLYPVRPCVLLG